MTESSVAVTRRIQVRHTLGGVMMLMDVVVGEWSSEMFFKVLRSSNSSSFCIVGVSARNKGWEVKQSHRMHWDHIHITHLIPLEDL